MIPMFNMAPQLAATKSAWTANLDRLFTRMHFITGEQLEAFEHEFAAAMDARFSVGVGTGTAAIELCLRAAGLAGSGREVIVPSLTSLFSAQAIAAAGCVPRIADVNPETLLLDTGEVERLLNKKTGAILPVHLYGHACEMPRLTKLAREARVTLVQDACQAHGARSAGRPLTDYSPFVAFSFYPTKNLGALGDGGAVTTNRGTIADRVRLLRDGGRRNDQQARLAALNSRLDEMQCCYLRAFLTKLREWTEARGRLASMYDELFRGNDLIRPVPRGDGSADHLYVVRVPQRDKVRAKLTEQGIMTAIHYPIPLHRQPAFRSVERLPHTEKACREILSLPLWPYLEESSVQQIADTVKSIVTRGGRLRI
jgi:dTDP-3-amino-3,4,6-trideoxy-alpha-D-glucose transaminase